MRSIYVFLCSVDKYVVQESLLFAAVHRADFDDWVLPNADDPVLYVSVDTDVQGDEPENIEAVRATLVEEPSVVVVVDVSGRHQGADEAKEFTIAALSRFPGVAQDDYSSHAWTREQILADELIDGRRFFLG